METTTVYVFLKDKNWYVRFKGKSEYLPLPFSSDYHNFSSIVSELQRNILPPNSEIICAMSGYELAKNDLHVHSMEFYGFDVCETEPKPDVFKQKQ